MNYIEVFSTSDRNELSILKNLFDDEAIIYITHGEATDSAANIGGMGNYGLRMDLAESDLAKATEIIKRSGFLVEKNTTVQSKKGSSQIAKWIIIFFAVFVIITIILLFGL